MISYKIGSGKKSYFSRKYMETKDVYNRPCIKGAIDIKNTHGFIQNTDA